MQRNVLVKSPGRLGDYLFSNDKTGVDFHVLADSMQLSIEDVQNFIVHHECFYASNKGQMVMFAALSNNEGIVDHGYIFVDRTRVDDQDVQSFLIHVKDEPRFDGLRFTYSCDTMKPIAQRWSSQGIFANPTNATIEPPRLKAKL